MEGESEELPVSCLCSLKPTDNGNCFGCKNNGNADMKHPIDVGYAGGHVMKTFWPFSGPRIPAGYFDNDNLEAEEATLRRDLKCLNDPHRMKRMRSTLPGSKAKETTGALGDHLNVNISKQLDHESATWGGGGLSPGCSSSASLGAVESASGKRD